MSAPLFPVSNLVLWTIAPVVSVLLWLVFAMGTSSEGALVRFVNAMLTSFTLVSFLLLMTLIVYGDARKRPISPLLGMGLCVSAGVACTVFFLSQGDLLMEDNGSVRAQCLVQHHSVWYHSGRNGGGRDHRWWHPARLPYSIHHPEHFLRRRVKISNRNLAVDFIKGRSVDGLFR